MADFLPHTRLDDLLAALRGDGRRVLGPQLRDGIVAYRELDGAAALPWGMTDRQAPGHYRLQAGGAPGRAFAWTHAAQCLKPLTFAAEEPLWRSVADANGVRYAECRPDAGALAVLGVRACDLAGLARQDRIFLADGRYDPHYAARRQDLFLVAVNCTHAAETCFCVATDTGPRARPGHDIALTELDGGFVAEAGSPAGQRLLDSLGLEAATGAQCDAAEAGVRDAAAMQSRTIPGGDLGPALYAQAEHPRWEAVAARCLACGNCTQVCPTCFCHAREDEATPDGREGVRMRRWDSCFGALHGHLAGFQVRPETRHRYRQWLTHKLGGWWQQFGESGCVGCGRCIAWCPAGIDLTEEAQALLGAAR